MPQGALKKGMKNLNACQLTTSVTAIANALANHFADDELAVLASIFVQLGDTLATILAQRAICEEKEAEKSNLQEKA